MNKFLQNFFSRPPIVFPLVSIFLIAITVYDITEWVGLNSVYKIYWLKPLPLVLYSIFWLAATMLKRWAAAAFIVLSIVHIALFLFLQKDRQIGAVLDNFMVSPLPLGMLFSFIMLIYFRKLR